MNTPLPAGVGIGAISEGTMRPQDVIPKMLCLLELLNPKMAEHVKEQYKDVIESDYGTSDERRLEDTEAVGWMWEAVFDDINTCLPEGYWFGPTEGDGACLGVWSIDK